MKRDDESFAITYELLKSEKDRKFYVKNRELDELRNSIFKPVANQKPKGRPQIVDIEENQYKYGKSYKIDLKKIYDRLIFLLG